MRLRKLDEFKLYILKTRFTKKIKEDNQTI